MNSTSQRIVFLGVCLALLISADVVPPPTVYNDVHTQPLCTAAFCLDKSWPDQDTVPSIPFYGSAIALDRQRNVVVLHRSTSMGKEHPYKDQNPFLIEEDVIMVLDSLTGKILKTWGGGKKFSRPHGIEITDDGSILITDVKLHQFTFNATSGIWHDFPEITLGERFIPGADKHHFCSPADVAVLPTTEDIFIADGYCNSRVIKFNKFGAYLSEFQAGSSDSRSPPISFNITHAIKIALPYHKPAISIRTTSGMAHDDPPTPIIFVADRNNARVQSFLQNGTFLYEIGSENFGNEKEMLFSLDFTSASSTSASYGKLYVVNGHLPVGQSKIFEISVGLSGFVKHNSFPISPRPENGTSLGSKLEIPHDLAVSKNGQFLYVIEAGEKLMLKKFVRNQAHSLAASFSLSNTGKILLCQICFGVVFWGVSIRGY